MESHFLEIIPAVNGLADAHTWVNKKASEET